MKLDASKIMEHKVLNLLHSFLLILGMLLLVLALGWAAFGKESIVFFVVLAFVFFVLSPRLSPAIVLKMYGARPLRPNELPELHQMVRELASRAHLAKAPTLYYVSTPMINAFTLGGKSSAFVAVTSGLLKVLDLRELAGVLAHEISHIKNNDMWVMSLSDMSSRVTAMFSMMGQILLFINLPLIVLNAQTLPWLPILLLILSPTINLLLQLALSRTREFAADIEAATLTGDPNGLASALKKMEQYQSSLISKLFLPGRRNPHPSVLRTHPHTEERIRRLVSLSEKKPDWGPGLRTFGPSDFQAPSHLTRMSGKPRTRIGGIWY